MTVIGLLPPIVNGKDDLLVDGGYANNLPVDVMHQMPHRPKTLISVDVENRDVSVFSNLYDYGTGISGFRVLWEMINPFKSFKKNVPSFSDIVLFLNCISHMRQLRTLDESLVSMYINPPVTKYHLLDYPKLDELVHKGYTTGIKVIDAWLEQNEDEFVRSRGSRQRRATAMAQARSRTSLHLRSLKSAASISNIHPDNV
jgi:predicted acylesterase/phospholipase RssA